MKKFEERRTFRRSMYSKPVILFLLVLAGILTRAAWHGYLGSKIAAENLEVASLEKQELDERINSLEADLSNLETERGLEAAYRSKFGVAKEGEEVIVLVDPENQSASSLESGGSFWSSFLRFFMRD